MRRTLAAFPFVLLVLLTSTVAASAQGLDLTVFLGRAYPLFDERLTLRPGAPAPPGVDVTVTGTPEIRGDGGLVFGGALAFELGILAVEGRLDATNLGFDFTGARYDVRATVPPFQDVAGSVTIADGRMDADRLHLLSLNLRLRTPGPVGIVASGGVSYLPQVTVTGSVPLSVQPGDIVVVPGLEPRLHLRAAPGAPDHRFGVNGGAGLRIGGRRVALMAEVRVFYFREFELRFGVDGAPGIINDLIQSLPPVRFEPVIVNGQAGLVFRF